MSVHRFARFPQKFPSRAAHLAFPDVVQRLLQLRHLSHACQHAGALAHRPVRDRPPYRVAAFLDSSQASCQRPQGSRRTACPHVHQADVQQQRRTPGRNRVGFQQRLERRQPVWLPAGQVCREGSGQPEVLLRRRSPPLIATNGSSNTRARVISAWVGSSENVGDGGTGPTLGTTRFTFTGARRLSGCKSGGSGTALPCLSTSRTTSACTCDTTPEAARVCGLFAIFAWGSGRTSLASAAAGRRLAARPLPPATEPRTRSGTARAARPTPS